MNYLEHYNKLIKNAKIKNRCKSDSYFEAHHIIPRSCGGLDDSTNIVLLTAREHYVAHLLLTKIYTHGQEQYKVNQAFVLMGGRFLPDNRRNSSKLYEKSRRVIAKEISKRHTGTLIVKDSVSGIRIGRVKKDHPKVVSGEWVFFHKGLKRSDEYKKKISESCRGTKNGNFSGLSNEYIISRWKEYKNILGFMNTSILRFCLQLKESVDLPKSMSGQYRKSLKEFIKSEFDESCPRLNKKLKETIKCQLK